jgi:hypothetical protein
MLERRTPSPVCERRKSLGLKRPAPKRFGRFPQRKTTAAAGALDGATLNVVLGSIAAVIATLMRQAAAGGCLLVSCLSFDLLSGSGGFQKSFGSSFS